MNFPSEKDNSTELGSKDDSTELGSKDETILVQQLKMQFHSTNKGDRETIESYVKNLKSTADSLTAIGSLISDPDLVLQLLAGLPYQYLPYKNRISSQFPLPDFSKACSLLYMYETLLHQQKANPATSPLEEEGNYSNKETFGKILDVIGTVSSVVSTAWDVWSMFRTSSTTASTGNKKYTKRGNGGRGNYNKRGPSAGGYRNSGRK